jgi:hypothetical protein
VELKETWDAFWLLSRSRAIGFGTGPIPLSEIAAFIQVFDIERPSFFVRCINELDSIWLEHEAKKSKTKQKSRSAVPSVKPKGRRRGNRRT